MILSTWIKKYRAPALYFFQLVKEGYAFFDKKGLHFASCLDCTPTAYNSTLRSVRSVFCDVHAAGRLVRVPVRARRRAGLSTAARMRRSS